MGWRDIYKVHPAADCWPMLPDDELAKLKEDIAKHGVRVPIGLYDETDASGGIVKTWLIDGRNRLEAAERAGVDIETIPAAHVHCSDPVSWIISLNARRRHLTKQEIADGIVKSLKVAEAEELKRNVGREAVSRQDGEKPKAGRKPDKLRAKAIATAKEVGISPRTTERSLAKDKGKKPSKRHRRTDAGIKRDGFIRFVDSLDGYSLLEASDPADQALDLLTKDERAHAIEAIEMTIARLRKIIDRLRVRADQ